MKKLRITSILILGVASLLFAGNSEGKPGHGGHGHCMMNLNLTEAQKSEIKAYRDEFHTNLQSLEHNDPVLSAITGGSFDTGAYVEAATTGFNAFVALEAEYVSYAYNVLSDEQKTAYAKALADTNTSTPPCRGMDLLH